MTLIQHSTIEDAKNTHLKKFGEAVIRGKWLAMVCHIKEDGSATVDTTTHDFPTDRFDFAIREFADSCEERRKGVVEKEKPQPLPLAPHLKLAGDFDGAMSNVGLSAEDLDSRKLTEEEKKILHDDSAILEGLSVPSNMVRGEEGNYSSVKADSENFDTGSSEEKVELSEEETKQAEQKPIEKTPKQIQREFEEAGQKVVEHLTEEETKQKEQRLTSFGLTGESQDN